jgi:GNAT superfamily N-acetyltransferase
MIHETAAKPDGEIIWVTHSKGEICREILCDLPEWFGIPDAIADYMRSVEELPMFGFRCDGSVVAFLSVRQHTAAAAEAFVLGVKRRWHRREIGRRLFNYAEGWLVARQMRFFTVKTISPQRPNAAYRETRLFYEAIGFSPIEVFPTLWGAANPCLLMIKVLDSSLTNE